MRTADEFFGSFCSFFDAEKNSVSVVVGLMRMAFSSARLAANLAASLMRFLLRSMAEVFGMAWEIRRLAASARRLRRDGTAFRAGGAVRDLRRQSGRSSQM